MTPSIHYTPKKPYIAEQTIKLGRKTEMLRKKFFKRNTPFNEFQYKSAKREHQKMVRKDKNTFYNKKLEQCKTIVYCSSVLFNKSGNYSHLKLNWPNRETQDNFISHRNDHSN